VELTPDEEKRAIRLHKENIVIDFHLHTRVLPEDMKDMEEYIRGGRIATGYEGLAKSGISAGFVGFLGGVGRRHFPIPFQWDDMVWDLGMRQGDWDHHKDVVIRGYCVKDILEAKKTGRTALIPMIENPGGIGDDLDKLDVLYGMGIRMLGLSYNHRTTIADGVLERTDAGLSTFGYKVIRRMNRLGIAVDFSHSSNLTIKEGLEASERPCCCSHTLARAVNNNPKGKTDEILELFAKHGGLVGVQAVPNITSKKPVQTVFDVMDHVDYIVKVIGVEHVAIGTDTLFGDHVGCHKHTHEQLGLSGMLPDFPATHIDYIENPGEWPNVTRALVLRGYPDEDIKKLTGENVLKFLEKTIG
jgi:membrane dipeptidase